MAIHASVKPLSATNIELANRYGIKNIQFGRVLLICDLVDCILMTPEFIELQTKTEKDFGDWRVGRYAWRLSNIRILPVPPMISGRQGLWNLDVNF